MANLNNNVTGHAKKTQYTHVSIARAHKDIIILKTKSLVKDSTIMAAAVAVALC